MIQHAKVIFLPQQRKAGQPELDRTVEITTNGLAHGDFKNLHPQNV